MLVNQLIKYVTPCVVKTTGLYEHGRISITCFSPILLYDVSTTSEVYVCPPHARLYDVGLANLTEKDTFYNERQIVLKPFIHYDGIQILVLY